MSSRDEGGYEQQRETKESVDEVICNKLEKENEESIQLKKMKEEIKELKQQIEELKEENKKLKESKTKSSVEKSVTPIRTTRKQATSEYSPIRTTMEADSVFSPIRFTREKMAATQECSAEGKTRAASSSKVSPMTAKMKVRNQKSKEEGKQRSLIKKVKERTEKDERVHKRKRSDFHWEEVKKTNREKRVENRAEVKAKCMTPTMGSDIPNFSLGMTQDLPIESPDAEKLNNQQEKAYKELVFPAASEVLNLMSEEDKNIIKQIHLKGKNFAFWSGKSGDLYLNHIEPLWTEQMLSSQLLNTWTCMLEDKQEELMSQDLSQSAMENEEMQEKSFFMPSECWTFINFYKNDESARKHYIKILKEAKDSECRFIHFPMTTPGRTSAEKATPIHWSLMVFDRKDECWNYYNSLMPKKGGQDFYFKDAQTVVNQAVRFWNNLDGKKVGEDSPKINYMDFSPQQGSGTLDCGIFVMKIMECFVTGEQIPKKLSKHEVSEIKKNMISKIIHHKFTKKMEFLKDSEEDQLIADIGDDDMISNVEIQVENIINAYYAAN